MSWFSFFRSRSSAMLNGMSSKTPRKEDTGKLYRYDAQTKRWTQGAIPTTDPSTVADFSLISWNVDFAAPLVVRRFQAALSHLEKLVPPGSPQALILLQEVHTSCFQTLLANNFVREYYAVTNISSRQSYSTLTLVSKSLAPMVSSVSRIPFADTRMQRDCLYIDIDVPLPLKPKTTRLRIANTHLESLSGFGDTARPKQLKAISQLLTASEVDGGLVAGDMNSISPSDQNLPDEVGLSDAWLVVDAGAETGEADGHTWGYQPTCAYPPRRLDKILTTGKLDAVNIERVGVGLQVEDRETWVSDHYGLFAKIRFQS
ncbi:Endonuclease/exonuclease/phosphatase [Mycena crocata]|nr:Endonuclease/exonuclease/phosphatase [Mycena crocata]